MANDCTPLNPCNCISTCKCNTEGTPSPKPPCPSGNCLFLCDGVVAANDGVGCGQTGSVDVTTFEHDFSSCDSGPTFTVTGFDSIIGSASFSGSTLSWTPSGTSFGYGDIRIKTTCTNSDGKKLSYHSCVTIGVTDMCLMSDVPEGCICNPCNGNYICTEGQEVEYPTGPDFPTTTTTDCTDPVTYTIISYDDTIIANVLIDSDGNITADLVCSDKLKINQTTQVVYEASACGASQQGVEIINIPPPCLGVVCPENHKCNHCTGECEELPCPETYTDTGDSLGNSTCVKDKGETVLNTVKPSVIYQVSGVDSTCYTDITPTTEPPTPPTDEEICEKALSPFKGCQVYCLQCIVVDGEPCITKVEEIFPLEELDDVCPEELKELTGTCCTKKLFKGRGAETWNNQDHTVCKGDPYTVIGSCGTPKEFIGTQERTWSCGDTDNYCGAYTVTDTCGDEQICQGTRVPTVLNPLKPEVLAAICSTESIDCETDCNTTIKVFGTKDCNTQCVDTVWTPETNTECSGVNFTQTSNCNNTRPAVGTQDCSTCPNLIAPTSVTIINSSCTSNCTPNCPNNCGESDGCGGTCPDNSSNSCAASTCVGQICTDSCGNIYNGTMDCGVAPLDFSQVVCCDPDSFAIIDNPISLTPSSDYIPLVSDTAFFLNVSSVTGQPTIGFNQVVSPSVCGSNVTIRMYYDIFINGNNVIPNAPSPLAIGSTLCAKYSPNTLGTPSLCTLAVGDTLTFEIDRYEFGCGGSFSEVNNTGLIKSIVFTQQDINLIKNTFNC